MLNLIDDMCAAAATMGRDAAIARCLKIQREHLEASRLWPYRPLAAALGVAYSTAIVMAGVIARVLGRHRPDDLIRRLAHFYCQVPEMILHKGIELRSLTGRQFAGRGLDLGCGGGIVGDLLIEEAGLFDLHGVDISPVDEGTILSHGYTGYAVADMQSLPYDNGSFDFIVSICVIEHVTNLDAALSEAARVLRAGGRFYFTTQILNVQESLVVYRLLDRIGLHRQAKRFKEFRDIMAMHHNCLSAEQWQERLQGAGFTGVEVEPIFTRRQLLAYDVMNFQVYFLKLYFYEHLNRWVSHSPRYRRLMEWAAAEICANVTAEVATVTNATHFSIACRKV